MNKIVSIGSLIFLLSCTGNSPSPAAQNLINNNTNPSLLQCADVISEIKKMNTSIKIDILTENEAQIVCQNVDPSVQINYGINASDNIAPNMVNDELLATISQMNKLSDIELRANSRASIKAIALSYKPLLSLTVSAEETVEALGIVRANMVISSRSPSTLVSARALSKTLTSKVSATEDVGLGSYLSELSTAMVQVASLPSSTPTELSVIDNAMTSLSVATSAEAVSTVKTSLPSGIVTPPAPEIILPSFVSVTNQITALSEIDSIDLPYVFDADKGSFVLKGTIQGHCAEDSDIALIMVISSGIGFKTFPCVPSQSFSIVLEMPVDSYDFSSGNTQDLIFRFVTSGYGGVLNNFYTYKIKPINVTVAP